MKPKRLSKKLTLNKKTITHLTNGDMSRFKGGLLTKPTRCIQQTCFIVSQCLCDTDEYTMCIECPYTWPTVCAC